MSNLGNCQLPCLPNISTGIVNNEPLSLKLRIKRLLAVPWNYFIKKNLKQIYKFFSRIFTNLKQSKPTQSPTSFNNIENSLVKGDWIRVRTLIEIQSTLDRWNELKGCAFLPYMSQYCESVQQVLVSMERFLDERDYKVKKCKGIVLLKGVMCEGTPVFGQCDRRCHLFWREEWLEKVSQADILKYSGLD